MCGLEGEFSRSIILRCGVRLGSFLDLVTIAICKITVVLLCGN